MQKVCPAVPIARVVDDTREWENLGAAWSALFAASPYASPPLDFPWLRRPAGHR